MPAPRCCHVVVEPLPRHGLPLPGCKLYGNAGLPKKTAPCCKPLPARLILAQAIPNAERLEVYGPADAPLALVRGRRRKRLLVRADRDVNLQAFLRVWLQRVKTPASVRLTVDVDPYSFL